jgi:hypothetical protein
MLFDLSSTDMQLNHLAEMETQDGQRDGQREQPGSPEQGPEEESPIVDALGTADTQLVDGPA